jgi:hypothetical protein
MTTGTEMLLIIVINSCYTAIVIGRRVAIDTADQAMLFGADSLVHRAVAFMLQIFHVIGAHISGRLDTLLTFGHRHNIAIAITIGSGVVACRNTN